MRHFPGLLLTLVLLNGCSKTDTEKVDFSAMALQCQGCNILLLNIELLRADYTGLIGKKGDSATINIDNFFKKSIQFTDATSPAGESYRSNLSILTSRQAFDYPYSQQNIDKYIKSRKNNSESTVNNALTEQLIKFPSVAESFNANGYHTISLNQGIRAGSHLHLDRGFNKHKNWNQKQEPFENLVRELNLTLDSALRPFFILFRPETLHPFPYYYPDSRKNILESTDISIKHRKDFGMYAIRARGDIDLKSRRVAHHAIYQQQVRYVDEQLQIIFDKLRQNNLLENTIVVLYSNHGSGLGDNGIDKLAVSYQSCVHVPLLVLHPKITNPVIVADPVSLVDLAPTLLDLVSLPPMPTATGKSLIRTYSKSDPSATKIAGRNDADEFIRNGTMKLIVKNAERHELYDLSADPGETNDLSAGQNQTVQNLEQDLIKIKLGLQN